jgi:hypothetical protein
MKTLGFGLILKDKGAYREAEGIFRNTIEGYQKFGAKYSNDHESALEYLEVVLTAQGRWAEAETLLRQSVQSRKWHGKWWNEARIVDKIESPVVGKSNIVLLDSGSVAVRSDVQEVLELLQAQLQN